MHYCYTLVFNGDQLRLCSAEIQTPDQAIQHGRVLLDADLAVVAASVATRPAGICTVFVGDGDAAEPVGCWNFHPESGEFTWRVADPAMAERSARDLERNGGRARPLLRPGPDPL